MEINHARTLIMDASPWQAIEHFTYYPNYVELARMESEGGRLQPGDRVVFLGSGPLPLTLICLCSQYQIQGVGIEQCGEYADLSRQLIAALGLSDQIRIIEGNHFSLPLQEPCQLIMVGADAMPKKKFFPILPGICLRAAGCPTASMKKALEGFWMFSPALICPSDLKRLRASGLTRA